MRQGDKVPVRLETGQVVEAVYSHAAAHGKNHWVKRNGELLLACKSSIGGQIYQRCRFVGPCSVAVPSGVRA